MLPLCSPTNSKVSSCGGFKSFSSYWMTFDANHNSFDRVSRNISNMASFKRIPSSCIHFNVGNSIPRSICENGSLNLRQSALSSYHIGVIDEPHYVRSNGMMILENSTNSNSHDQLVNFVSSVIDNTEVLPSLADVESVTPFKSVSHPVYDAFSLDATSLSSVETTFSDIVSKMRESAADTFYRGQSYLNNVSGSVTSSLTATIKHTNQAVEISINEITSFINKSAGSVSCKLDGLSSEVKEASGRAGPFALDVLRGTVIVVENSLLQGGKTIGDAYSFVKEFLPSEVQEAVGLSEEKVGKVLIPAGTVLHQIYLVVEGFEESLGLDPNDPLVPFLLFLGFSVTLWGSYRIVKYGGYAGDSSPLSALELVERNENAVLVDIRPEIFKERDGVPDLRWAARFRYASVHFPRLLLFLPSTVDGSVKKLLKGGRDIEYILLAAVIRNLNIVDEKSKVLVMDADGTFSKGVARSLRKLGTKKPYMVKGGFHAWIKDGLPVKMVKPETALTIFNEEAEAILEEIKLTPLKTIGFGLVFAAATYSVVEWERTLQFIGVIGLGQSLFRRVASYEDVEDLKQDLRLLLTPVRVGGHAISWAAGKLGSNGNGLPTSPSSSEVQSRVLQAAAKHESQLSNDEGAEYSSETESFSDQNENI